jgi:hypothetical protein
MGSIGRILQGSLGERCAEGGKDCGDFDAEAAEVTEKERRSGSAEF